MTIGGEGSGARLLDGRAMAADMLAEATREIADITSARGTVPEVRVVLVGDDAASAMYARRIVATAGMVGSRGEVVRLAASVDPATVCRTLDSLSHDEAVAGVILQLPLPPGLHLGGIIGALDPTKDLDGIHPVNAGLISRRAGGFAPSCAEAALQILRRSQIQLAGRAAVVIGRSNVVGRPAQLLLIEEDATVTICHRRTRDLDDQIRRAEIVVVAAGSPGLVRGPSVRPGAVVIDCGINVLADGHVVGDVDLPSVLPVAGALTPVPGGVGPVTNAVLMEHLARAARAELRARLPTGQAVAS
jgi:methylenetetrahydrofolate dehydrogenase (NADP+)/methenyltetrahydrofolate cyclohydrolase